MTTGATTDEMTVTGERADLITALRTNRDNLRHTVRGLTDEQAGLRTTVSALTLGGLVKHLTHGERQWMAFAVGGAAAMFSGTKPWSEWDASDYARYSDGFRLTADETLAGALADYERTARRTDELVATLDLNTSHPLPEAPWFPAGASWSVRSVLLHLIAETAQHAGHADIIREALDGQKTMA
ncbi:MAG TPA: DinB family protein [Pseudonocardia sp.]|jgi:hypothetical protein|nr:DinB family protein [Pseudonocardia sp.]